MTLQVRVLFKKLGSRQISESQKKWGWRSPTPKLHCHLLPTYLHKKKMRIIARSISHTLQEPGNVLIEVFDIIISPSY